MVAGEGNHSAGRVSMCAEFYIRIFSRRDNNCGIFRIIRGIAKENMLVYMVFVGAKMRRNTIW
jgi:hypothetical protein